MTNKEAIYRQDALDLAKKGILISNGNYESVCKAIIELPSVNPIEPCGDAIDRAEAIKIASGYCHPANVAKELAKLPPVNPQEPRWIPVSERLPETDNENNINNFDVLLWVRNKTHPERKPQIYIGKLRRVNGDDGSGNFWGIETKPCEWTIWGWSYFNEPEVIAWMPLPKPYEPQESEG